MDSEEMTAFKNIDEKMLEGESQSQKETENSRKEEYEDKIVEEDGTEIIRKIRRTKNS